MFAHSLIHGFVAFFTRSVLLGLAETIVHFIVDVLKCEKLINFHLDQLLHVLSKSLWIYLLVSVGLLQ